MVKQVRDLSRIVGCVGVGLLVTVGAVAQSSIRAWGRYCYDTRGRSEPVMNIAAGEFATATVTRSGFASVNGGCDGGHLVPALSPGQRYIDIGVGTWGAAALVSDGSIVSWGVNAFFGGYPLLPTLPPTPPLPPGTQYVQVAVGNWHIVALRSDGVIVAWGTNGSGQCNVPPIPPGRSVHRVIANRAYSFAILSDGSLLAWGDTTTGILPPPTFPAAVIDVHPGASHCLAVCADGSAVAWGGNQDGQCNVPALPVGTSYLMCSAGGHFSCALRSDNVIVTWGVNHATAEPPPVLPSGVTVLQMRSGYLHTAVLLSNGEVRVWGDSDDFQARLPGLPFAANPSGAAQFLHTSHGYWHACAVRSDGGIEAWGEDDASQTVIPWWLQTGRYVKAGAHTWHSGALRADGQLFLWGDNTVGQCNVPALPPGVIYTDFSIGLGHTVALRSDGQAVAFGQNVNNCLHIPVLPAGTSYVQCGAQYLDSVYLRSDGQVITSQMTGAGGPGPAPLGLEYTDIGAGEVIVGAVRSDGTPHWWKTTGWNPPSPSGIAAWMPLSAMPPLPFGVYYVEVDCGNYTAIWRRSDGTVSVSGSVGYAQDRLPHLEPGTSYLGVSANWDTVSGRVGSTCTYVSFAQGCAGSQQAARLVPRDTPRIGKLHEITVFDLPQNLAVLGMGFSRPPQPVSLAALGMPGCSLHIDVDAVALLTGQWNRAKFSLPIPERAALVGLRFYQQAMVLDPGAGNPAGAVMSNAAEGVVGHR